MKSHIQQLKFWNFILPLSICLFIYLFFRTEDTIINKVVANFLPNINLNVSLNIADWIIYNLPGALWLFAFLSISIVKNEKGLLYCLIPLSGALIIELMQYLSLTDGTYDVADVFFYLAAWVLFMLIWRIQGNKIRWFRSAEKITKVEFSVLVIFFAIVIFSDVYA